VQGIHESRDLKFVGDSPFDLLSAQNAAASEITSPKDSAQNRTVCHSGANSRPLLSSE